jgi:hypothetical protein
MGCESLHIDMGSKTLLRAMLLLTVTLTSSSEKPSEPPKPFYPFRLPQSGILSPQTPITTLNNSVNMLHCYHNKN